MQMSQEKNSSTPSSVPPSERDSRVNDAATADDVAAAARPREIGGPSGPEPTRFGDWERKGRCIDF
jgi:hypothetical protein